MDRWKASSDETAMFFNEPIENVLHMSKKGKSLSGINRAVSCDFRLP